MKNRLIAYLGSEDIDKRIDLLLDIREKYQVIAIGSSEQIRYRFEAVGIEYLCYPLKRQLNIPADLVALISLIRLLRKQHIDLLHTFDTKPAILGRLAGWVVGVPITIGTLPGLGILYTRDDLKTRIIRAIYQPLQWLACKVSNVTIFQNEDDRELFSRLGIVSEAKSVLIQGSGIKTDEYNQARFSQDDIQTTRRRFGIPCDAVVVIMIARLLRSKGVLEFVEVARILTPALPQAHFVLVGMRDEGNDDSLTDAEMQLVEAHVQWLKAQPDIPAILASSDIFVLPSSYREGIPRVLLEAASTGLPLVSYDMPGCKEIVKHGVTGLLVQQPNVPHLASAIEQLVTDPRLRTQYGKAARIQTENNFAHSIVVKNTLELYTRFIG